MCKTPSPSLFFPLFTLFVLVSFGQLQASIITTPTDLNVGDQYRLVFVTSGTMTAESGDIADYNAFVDGFGDIAIASDWKAIASTEGGVDAHDNIGTAGGDGVSIYNLAGERVANNYSDFWDGSIQTAIKYDESGAAVGGADAIWTGSTTAGETAYGLGTDVIYGSTYGAANGSSDIWIDYETTQTDDPGRLYGMSDIFTVPSSDPIPEPASVISWTLLGIVGCVGTWWNRRRKAS